MDAVTVAQILAGSEIRGMIQKADNEIPNVVRCSLELNY